MPVWDNIKELYIYSDWNIFIPISKLKSFYQINETEPEKLGFFKTNIVYKILKN
jgi:hypothetical protein